MYNKSGRSVHRGGFNRPSQSFARFSLLIPRRLGQLATCKWRGMTSSQEWLPLHEAFGQRG